MFFTDREKQVYTPAGADPAVTHYDPLHLVNLLTVATGGGLHGLISDRNAFPEAFAQKRDAAATGIPPPPDEQMREAAVCTARAELTLAPVARQAFGLPPEATDAAALETLFDFLGWLEKKD